jgi:hypothetical protein
VAITTRWPTRTCESQPPIAAKYRKLDVRDLEADLVDVPDAHQAGRAGRVEHGDRIAARVGMHGVGHAAHLLAPDARGGGLEAGGSRCVEQPVQELEGLMAHGGRNLTRFGHFRHGPASIASLADGTDAPPRQP